MGPFFPVELSNLSDSALWAREFIRDTRGQECSRTKVTGTKLEAGQTSTGESPGPAGSHCHQELLRPRKGSLETKHPCRSQANVFLIKADHKQSLLKSLLKDIPNHQQASVRWPSILLWTLIPASLELFKHHVTGVSRKENKQGAPAGGPTAQGDLALSAGLRFLTPRAWQGWPEERLQTARWGLMACGVGLPPGS